MSKYGEYFVEQHEKGWAVKLPYAERASAVSPTRLEAIAKAKQLAPQGVVHIKQQNRKFRKG